MFALASITCELDTPLATGGCLTGSGMPCVQVRCAFCWLILCKVSHAPRESPVREKSDSLEHHASRAIFSPAKTPVATSPLRRLNSPKGTYVVRTNSQKWSTAVVTPMEDSQTPRGNTGNPLQPARAASVVTAVRLTSAPRRTTPSRLKGFAGLR